MCIRDSIITALESLATNREVSLTSLLPRLCHIACGKISAENSPDIRQLAAVLIGRTGEAGAMILADKIGYGSNSDVVKKACNAIIEAANDVANPQRKQFINTALSALSCKIMEVTPALILERIITDKATLMYTNKENIEKTKAFLKQSQEGL